MFIRVGKTGINLNQIRYWQESQAKESGPLKVQVDMSGSEGTFDLTFEGSEAIEFLEKVEQAGLMHEPDYIPF